MKNEKLREIIENLEEIKNVKEQKEVMRIINCMAELKETFPKYVEKADKILDILSMQINGIASCYETECAIKVLIKELKEEEEREEVLEMLKDKCAEAKDKAAQAIPEVKKTFTKAITTAGNIAKGFADTINKEIPQISEGIGKVKEASRKTKKGIKSKIKEWALSDDEE